MIQEAGNAQNSMRQCPPMAEGLRLDPSLNSSFSRSMALVAAHVHNGDAGIGALYLRFFASRPKFS